MTPFDLFLFILASAAGLAVAFVLALVCWVLYLALRGTLMEGRR